MRAGLGAQVDKLAWSAQRQTSLKQRETERMGGEPDKPAAWAGREVKGVPSRQHCFLGEDGAEVIS